MYEYKRIEMSHTVRKEHEENFGGFNDWPPNVREIEPWEFWTHFMTYGPTVYEHRQMITRSGTDCTPVTREEMKCMHEQGVRNGYFLQDAYLFYRNRDRDRLWTRSGEGYIMTCTVTDARPHPDKFYKFGVCVHEFTEKLIGRCLREYKCSKCGYSYQVDSSD